MAWKKSKPIAEIEGGNSGCLRKFNYSNGAGWRTKNKGKITWGIKEKR